MSRAIRTRLGLPLAFALALAAAGTVTAASATSGPADAGRVIHFTTRPVYQSLIDTGNNGFGVDDIVIFSNDLYQGETKIGEDGGTCTVVRGGGELMMHCVGDNRLADGQIAVQGLAAPGEPFEFAITGGTGRYRDVRGQVLGENTATGMDIRLVLR
jgi:hypothetical protein